MGKSMLHRMLFQSLGRMPTAGGDMGLVVPLPLSLGNGGTGDLSLVDRSPEVDARFKNPNPMDAEVLYNGVSLDHFTAPLKRQTNTTISSITMLSRRAMEDYRQRRPPPTRDSPPLQWRRSLRHTQVEVRRHLQGQGSGRGKGKLPIHIASQKE